jgi:predicted amidohydrolase YtcJ
MGKIFQAKKIITMDGSHPFATFVAVEGNRIAGVGDSEVKDLFPDYQLDTTYQDKVILPGFIEAHSHALAGQDGIVPYAGYFDRPSVDGGTLKGHTTLASLIQYLSDEEKKLPEGQALLANGFDPIYFDGPRVSKSDLDKISTTRPVLLLHASGHLMTINSAALAKIPQDKLSSIKGIAKGADGTPSGELQEVEAVLLGLSLAGEIAAQAMDPKVLVPRYIALAKRAGCTTVGEMGGVFQLDNPAVIDELISLTSNAPVRIKTAYFAPTSQRKLEEQPRYVKELESKNTETLRFGSVKFIADGSLQGFTGCVSKAYVDGSNNGIWNMDPEKLKTYAKVYNAAEIQINCHCNGDVASQAFVDAVKEAVASHSWDDNRHTIQHAQLVDESQLQLVKQLGMGVNLFINHIYYWGDQHRDKILGVERAERMDPANMTLTLGIPFSMHSDANITPILPLMNVWCAVNRVTATGKVLGEHEKIPVEDALYAMTMGSAYLLKLDTEIGSITVGKKADFVVLGEDPYAVDPMKIKEIPVITTIFGGKNTTIAS